jgi:hypothetical protein
MAQIVAMLSRIIFQNELQRLGVVSSGGWRGAASSSAVRVDPVRVLLIRSHRIPHIAYTPCWQLWFKKLVVRSISTCPPKNRYATISHLPISKPKCWRSAVGKRGIFHRVNQFIPIFQRLATKFSVSGCLRAIIRGRASSVTFYKSSPELHFQPDNASNFFHLSAWAFHPNFQSSPTQAK